MDPTDLLLHPFPRRKRSLIRRISCWLPLPKPTRIHFQRELLHCLEPSQITYSGEFSDFLPKNLWYTPAPVTLADVTWLIRDEGEEGILLRCQLYGSHPIIASTPVSFHVKSVRSSVKCCAHGQGVLDAPTQTPINSTSYSSSFTSSIYRSSQETPVSSCITTDEAALERIRQLENDLMLMRQQLATITMKQEHLNGASVTGVGPPAPIPGVAPPPPGPPPPPPPPLPPAPLLSTPQMSLQEIIKNNKKSKGSRRNLNMTRNQIDMGEVLKGISSVKLRSIKRSPGGTPIREKPLSSDVNDPVAIISKALKKKFAACHLDSPDRDNSPTASGFSPSPRTNPTPPGPHLLRGSRLRRRSQNTLQ